MTGSRHRPDQPSENPQYFDLIGSKPEILNITKRSAKLDRRTYSVKLP